jgi:RNA polymerase primary sigma factor
MLATARKKKTDSHLQDYFDEISKIPLIDVKEEIRLTKLIKKGDKEALNKLVSANLRFVVSVAQKYQGQGLPFEDLINEGNLGLMKAAERFDETRGFKFISYAVWWIRQAILQALAEKSRSIRIPLNRINDLNRISKKIKVLEQTKGRILNSTDIAEALDMSSRDVNNIYSHLPKEMSLDAPLINYDKKKVLDKIPHPAQATPDNHLIRESMDQEIEGMLKMLTEKEATVLRLYFGIGVENPLSLEEIGRKLNLTRERIRQIKMKSLDKLKFKSKSSAMMEYLG